MICVGNKDVGFGLTNAFLLNTSVIQNFLPESKIFGFNEVIDETDTVYYVHGLPAQVESFIKQNLFAVSQAKLIAYLVCESTVLQIEYDYIKQFVDEIWTASSFCSDIYKKYFDCPVYVIPHVVDKQAIVRYAKPSLNTFLTVFDGGSRIFRKNPILVAEGFAEVLGKDKNSQLIIKTKNTNKQLLSYLKNLAPNISIIDSYLEENALQQLYALSSCYISLHAAEGFGLTVLEAMSYGLPGIVTGWSGTNDFFDENCGLKVDYTLAPTNDQFFLGEWAYPNKEDYKNKLLAFVEMDEITWLTYSAQATRASWKFNLGTLKRKIQNLL